MSRSSRHRLIARGVALAVVIGATVGLGACGTLGSDEPPSAHGGPLRVVASFYPLQWMAERVGGEHVQVANLTKPGAEPHDLELTPRDVAELADADVVAYLGGFQPAVEAALGATGAARFDARPSADLVDHRSLDLSSRSAAASAPGDDAEEGGTGGTDPHFWLDPTRLATVADAFAETLSDQDPAHAATYRTNAAGLSADLRRLDRDLEAGLDRCASRDLLTSHQSFGYLGERYGLRPDGISGLAPATEPSARDLARAAEFARANDVRTIYVESLLSPAVSRTVARETGAATAVLDPLEGLTGDARGDDYLSVMRANLAVLRTGQRCR